jgi:hypothetical protein
MKLAFRRQMSSCQYIVFLVTCDLVIVGTNFDVAVGYSVFLRFVHSLL